MARKTFTISLRTKLMALLLSMSLLLVAVTAYMAFLTSRHYLIESVARSLEGLANAKSQAIGNLIDDRRQQVEGLAVYPNIVSSLDKMLAEREQYKASMASAAAPTPASAAAPTNAPANEDPNASPAAAGAADPQTGPPSEGIFKETEKPKEQAEDRTVLEQSPEYKDLNKKLTLILDKGQKFEELFILDPAGTVVVSTVYEHEGKSAANAEFFTLGRAATYIQDVFVSEITKKLSMVVATPLKTEDGKALGVLGARLALDTLYQSVRDETGLGKTGEIVVGKRIDKDVVFMGPTRYDDKAALTRKIAVGASIEYPLQEASRGADGVGFYTDYRETPVLAAWQYVPSLEWGLVVKMDSREALESIKAVRNRIVVATLVILLVVAVLSHYVSKQIVRPIQELTEAADSISKGDTSITLSIKSRDEVGALADSFERMLASIRFLSEQEKAHDV